MVTVGYYPQSETTIEIEMRTFSLKLPTELEAKLSRIAREQGVSKSSLVREAITKYVDEPRRPSGESFLAKARVLAGCVSAAEDLSTNPAHLHGLGE